MKDFAGKTEERSEIGESAIGVNQFAGIVGEDKKSISMIGEEQLLSAAKILKSYRAGKAVLDERIIGNNEWYKLRHWGVMRGKTGNGAKDPEPASAWLFSVLNNKHADAMDNIPELSVLPREQGDVSEAEKLSSVIPVIMDQCQYAQVYSDMWWSKLKSGTGVTGVFWNPNKNNGAGDIDLCAIDVLNLYWEPGIKHLQDSANLFSVQLVNNDQLEAQYPQLKGALGGNDEEVKKYAHDDSIDTSAKSAVVDWYYKKTLQNKKQVLHYCKYTGTHLLYASENVEEYKERGFYDHGLYPFIFDVMFLEEDSPAGFGYLDLCKDSQKQIDTLNQAILKSALMATRPRYFIRGDGSVSEEEFANWDSPFVHYHGSGNPEENIFPVKVNTLPSIYVNYLDSKITEMKEVSGNRDFAQGGTASGVTAASAIAALQEAGNKLSRDMISSSYRAYEAIGNLMIELIRQFYTQPRVFRITGDNGMEFTAFDNSGIAPQQQIGSMGIDMGLRRPVFDIKVKSQKRSPFSTAVENERAKELFSMGFFNPEAAEPALGCLEMMTFEGKDRIVAKIQERADLHAQLQLAQQRIDQLTRIVDLQNGTSLNQAVQADTGAAQGSVPAAPTVNAQQGKAVEPNQLGAAVINRRTSPEGAARTQTAQAAAPRI